jgi:large subunit ribosomal protein L5
MKKSSNQPSELAGKGQLKAPVPIAKGSTKRISALAKAEHASEPIKRIVSPRLHMIYTTDVVPKLKKDFGYSNVMEVPRVVKVTINMGLGAAVGNPKIIESAVSELRAISGQSPVVTRAKKSIATFKLREGQKIGAMVTLRREKMWEFLDRLISFALPRVRDFKGISVRSFDGRGNFSTGIREQIIFPEISYERIEQIKGMNISIVTTAQTDEEGRALLRYLGMPFRS